MTAAVPGNGRAHDVPMLFFGGASQPKCACPVLHLIHL